jgi:nucleotide-binding universal stress UspA family protein
LRGHGVSAHAWTEVQEGTDLEALYSALKKEKCDLLVAGAYGHTRLREWVFGGVTMDLLLRGDRCVLLSH